MSRPKLTALADLMPPKGAATRQEPVVSLTAKQESEHGSKQTSEHFRRQTDKQAAAPTSLPLRSQVNCDHPSEYQDGPRSAVSFRMTERLQDRLREYAHQTRRKKQDILDQAVHEFLRHQGY